MKQTKTIYTGDNLAVLNGMNSEIIDLIYLDPPFNSKRMYHATTGSNAEGGSFKDIWTWDDVDETYLERLVTDYPYLAAYIKTIGSIHSSGMMSYITYMTQRLIELHRVLKPTGSFYLHCDPTASHYLKVVLDRIFGRGNFRNEIVWCYKTYLVQPKNNFPKKHDTILFYCKDSNKSQFNIYNDDNVKGTINYKRWKKYFNNKFEIVYGNHPTTDTRFNIYLQKFIQTNNREPSEGDVVYLAKGEPFLSYWDLKAVDPKSKERTGYPTQKPLSLLHRIIKASSNEGDLILDPFAGCATTCVAAEQLGRQWIGIDISSKAGELIADRLGQDVNGNQELFSKFVATKTLPVRTDLVIEKPTESVKDRLFKQQDHKCNGCFQEEIPYKLLEIDHIIPKSKGGGNYYENYQLLCGHCNKVKGNKPMDYLRMKMKKMEDLRVNKIGFGF